MLKLHGYFRSSAAYRVRIALNLKGLPYDNAFHHLTRGGGEHLKPGYLALNPQALVPALEDDGAVLTQSLAIIEYLEERFPEPALLPKDAVGRARVRAIALGIACEMHPLNNLRVLGYLTKEMGQSEADRNKWYRHWIAEGFGGIEGLLAGNPATGVFCHGDKPTMADCCLVPQVFNARRFNCDLTAFPTIVRIADHAATLPAFANAAPAKQPDAE
jgi:maleylacetoacetate isomerase/maleylpyruvate isomerase